MTITLTARPYDEYGNRFDFNIPVCIVTDEQADELDAACSAIQSVWRHHWEDKKAEIYIEYGVFKPGRKNIVYLDCTAVPVELFDDICTVALSFGTNAIIDVEDFSTGHDFCPLDSAAYE